jgi:hypothetical protein
VALVEITATSAGLTTASTAYVGGDMLGTQWSFASAVATSGGLGVIEGLVLLDESDIIGAVDLLLFNASVTQAADNAPNSWSDADMANCVGVISLPPAYDSALNRVISWSGALPIKLAATTLYAGFVTRSAHTFFGATTSLKARLYIRQE